MSMEVQQIGDSSIPRLDYQNSATSVREIWVRYTIAMALNTALMAGFLYFTQEPESRFRLGGIALAIPAMITGYIFDYKLPKQNQDSLLTVIDIITFVLAAIVFWLIIREVRIPQERVYAVVGNFWAWLCVWGFIATSRLKMAVRAVNLVRTEGTAARSYG